MSYLFNFNNEKVVPVATFQESVNLNDDIDKFPKKTVRTLTVNLPVDGTDWLNEFEKYLGREEFYLELIDSDTEAHIWSSSEYNVFREVHFNVWPDSDPNYALIFNKETL